MTTRLVLRRRICAALVATALGAVAAAGAPTTAPAQGSAAPRVRTAPTAAARPSWRLTDTTDADAVVRVVVENGPQTTLIALGRDTLLLLPVRQLFAMFEIAITGDSTGHSLSGLMDPAIAPVGFDTDRERLIGRDSAVRIPEGSATWQQGELYATPALIAQALRVRAEVDLGALIVTFMVVRDLPIMRRLERQRQRAIALRAGGQLAPYTVIEDHPQLVDGAVLDWSTISPLDEPTRLSSSRLSLGMQLVGGGLEVEQQQVGSGSIVNAQTTWSWMRAWADGKYVRQLGFGAVNTVGRRQRAITGALITNVPYFRQSDYSQALLEGRLPPGWELEVQRYGLPIGTVRPDPTGAWQFALPTSYGPNQLDLLAYGPGGVTRHWRSNLVIPFDRLTKGRFEYAVALGKCRLDVCDQTATADLRYGVTDWVTVQGGTSEYTLLGGARVSNPYAMVTAGILQGVNVTAEVVGGAMARGAVEYEPNADFRVDVSATAFDTTAGSRMVNRFGSTNRFSGRIFWRPLETRPGFWVSTTASREDLRSVVTTKQQFTVSAMRGVVRMQGSLLFDQTELGHGGAGISRRSGEATVESAVLTPYTWTRGMYARAAATMDEDGSLSQASAVLLNNISRRWRVEAGLQWVRGQSTPIATLQLQANLPSFQMVNTYQAIGGQVVGGQSLSGTALFNRARSRMVMGNDISNGRAIGYGGIDGDVFLDMNGNGRHDPNEPGIAGVRITVGSQQAVSDAAGQFVVGSLLSFVPTMVEPDSGSLPNPMWIIDRPALAVVPRPNSFAPLSIPVLPAGGIAGTIVLASGARGPAGAEVQILNLATQEIRRVVSFSDGSFEFYKLRPGSYEISASSATLKRAGATASSVTIEVPKQSDAVFIEGVRLMLTPEVHAPPPVPARAPAPVATPPAPAPPAVRDTAKPVAPISPITRTPATERPAARPDAPAAAPPAAHPRPATTDEARPRARAVAPPAARAPGAPATTDEARRRPSAPTPARPRPATTDDARARPTGPPAARSPAAPASTDDARRRPRATAPPAARPTAPSAVKRRPATTDDARPRTTKAPPKRPPTATAPPVRARPATARPQ